MGASLLALAVGQLAAMLAGRPPSSKLGSHKGSRVVTRFVSTTHSSVGASLLAMAMGQLAGMLDGLPSSRASPLPQGFSGGYKICVHHPFRCGSELARDGGGSGCGDVGRATVIASKLGSHRGSRVVTRFVSTTHSSVGASLLAMAMGQLAGMLDGLPSSASKPAPTRVLGWLQDLYLPPIPVWERACSRWRWVSWRGCWMDCRLCEQARSHKGSRVDTRFVSTTHSGVGASLLAMAGGQVAAMLAGRPSSRASSAPTRVLGWLQDLCLPPIPVWERACSRWRWVRLH